MAYLIARMARIRHDADGLFKSRCNIVQAATLKPFCGVEDIVPRFASNQRKRLFVRLYCFYI